MYEKDDGTVVVQSESGELMTIAIAPSRGRVKYPVITRKFLFGIQEVKLKKRLYLLTSPRDMQQVVNEIEKDPYWDMTKTQLKAILARKHAKSTLIRVDQYSRGMVDRILSNPKAEFAPMSREGRDALLGRVCHANNRYSIRFNKETREIEARSPAGGGFTLKLDPERFSEEFNGKGL